MTIESWRFRPTKKGGGIETGTGELVATVEDKFCRDMEEALLMAQGMLEEIESVNMIHSKEQRR